METEMPQGHVIKKKLVRSRKWKKLECDFAKLTYTLLIACVDSWGMLLADGLSLKFHLGPFDNHTPEDYEEALKQLVDVDLIRVWKHQEDTYLYLVGHDKEHSLRKRSGQPVVPRPDGIVSDDDIYVTPSVTSAGRAEGGRSSSGRTPEGGRKVSAYEEGVGSREKDFDACARVATSAPDDKKCAVSKGNTSPHISHKQPRSIIPHTKRRDLDPEILEVTSHHARLWKLDAPQQPSGDHRSRIEQAIEQHGLEACKHAVKGHWLRCQKEESSKWRDIWWAFPAEIVHGKRDSRKLNQGEFSAYSQAGRPKRTVEPKPAEPEKEYTPEEQAANVAKVKNLLASVFKEAK